jgi:hypothetical protein
VELQLWYLRARYRQDLLNHPELVSTDSTVTFMTALWFWMTAQAPKPSCHEAIRSSGFGMTINVINGGIEVAKGRRPRRLWIE